MAPHLRRASPDPVETRRYLNWWSEALDPKVREKQIAARRSTKCIRRNHAQRNPNTFPVLTTRAIRVFEVNSATAPICFSTPDLARSNCSHWQIRARRVALWKGARLLISVCTSTLGNTNATDSLALTTGLSKSWHGQNRSSCPTYYRNRTSLSPDYTESKSPFKRPANTSYPGKDFTFNRVQFTNPPLRV